MCTRRLILVLDMLELETDAISRAIHFIGLVEEGNEVAYG
jgi:hypothetical protein